MKTMQVSALITFMQTLIAEETNTQNTAISTSVEFHEFGLDSISAMFLIEQLEQKFKVSISPLHFWDYPTIEKLAHQIVTENT
ncbi:MAG: acyl carrier protein [Bacteroidota bacterium]